MFLLRHLCFFLLLCSTFKVFGVDFHEQEINDQVISQLYADHDECVIGIENEYQVFLNPKKIIPQKNGLFLETYSGKLFRLPLLLSNEHGCFITLDARDQTVYPIVKCKNCDRPFSLNLFNKGKCSHCGAQN